MLLAFCIGDDSYKNFTFDIQIRPASLTNFLISNSAIVVKIEESQRFKWSDAVFMEFTFLSYLESFDDHHLFEGLVEAMMDIEWDSEGTIGFDQFQKIMERAEEVSKH